MNRKNVETGNRGPSEIRFSEPRPQYHVSPFHVATVYVGLGDYDEAFQWLDNAFYALALAWLNVAPEYEVLPSDPRLQALIERIGLPNKS